MNKTTHKPRVYLLDVLQWLAMFDIVAYHADKSGPRLLLGVGLPLFLITTIAFSVRQQVGRSLVELAQRRWSRLMWPWLAWSGIYGLLQISAALKDGEGALAYLHANMLIYGTKEHLWFLPFAFFAGLGMYAAATRLRKLPDLPHLLIMLPVLVVCLMFSRNHWGRASDFPYTVWTAAVPSLPLGLLIGRWWEKGVIQRHRGSITALAVAVTVPSLWVLIDQPGYDTIARYGVAAGLVLIAFVLGSRKVPGWWHRVHDLLFGVYLIHWALLGFWNMFESKLGFDLSHNLDALVIMLISAALVLGIQKTVLKKLV